MNAIALAELWTHVREDYLLDAIPPSYAAGASKPVGRRRGAFGRFMSSGWAAAILSVIVAGGVLTGIILAGQGGPGAPPVGTNRSTETETEITPPPVDSETDTAPELVTGPDPEVTVPPVPSMQIPADREFQPECQIRGSSTVRVYSAHVYNAELSQGSETVEIEEEPMDVSLLRAYERAGKLSTVAAYQSKKVFKHPEHGYKGSTTYTAVQAVYDADYQPLDVDLNGNSRYLGNDTLPAGVYYIILEFRVDTHGGRTFTIGGEEYVSESLTVSLPYRLLIWPGGETLPSEAFPKALYKADIPRENMYEPKISMDDLTIHINDTAMQIEHSYLYLADYADGTYNYGISGRPMDADRLRLYHEEGLIPTHYAADSAFTHFAITHAGAPGTAIGRMELTAIYDADFQPISGETTGEVTEIMARLSELPDGTYYVILDLALRSTGDHVVNVSGKDYRSIYHRRSIPFRLVIGETDETQPDDLLPDTKPDEA